MSLLRALGAPVARPASLAFAACGLLYGTWAARMPEIQVQTGLGEGRLGQALVAAAVGLVASALVAGAAVGRWGTPRVTLVGLALFSVSVVGPGLAEGWASLAVALFVVGATSGLTDVAMNAWATDVETDGAGEILGACHGLFSLGGMVGAALGATASSAGWALPLHFAAAGGLGLAVVVGGARVAWRLPRPRPAAGGGPPLVAWPTGAVAGLCALSAAALIVEGAMADWSAIYLADARGASPADAALGFGAFSACMAAMRFASDALTRRLGGAGVGDRRVVALGGALAAVGLAGALAAPSALAAVAGFATVGLGMAGVVPALFRAAARVPGRTSGASIAAVTGAGYLGFLAGPPVIGAVAEGAGWVAAFGLLGALAAGVAIGATPAFRRARRGAGEPAPPSTV